MENSLTLMQVVSLAVADAINPCAMVVLLMLLMAIIIYHPENRRNVIWAGLAFSVAVFIMYLIYGLLIIGAFKVIQGISEIRYWFYKVLGAAAVLLGLLHLQDSIHYQPGGVATEMPLGWRSKVKKIISGVTSPWGAFTVGILVTLFLLPCTIGPYVVLAGILSFQEIIPILPMLLLYNLIFISPMLLITAIVYFGLGYVENISAWKDRNVHYLHFVSGMIILLIGVALLVGWL
jgi:hypothetical protein